MRVRRDIESADLEVQFESQLNITAVPRLRDCRRVCRRLGGVDHSIDGRIRQEEVWMIENIEKLGAELKISSFTKSRDPVFLVQGKIPIE
jgi:hypothetical protein